jgi:hypothetical protein
MQYRHTQGVERRSVDFCMTKRSLHSDADQAKSAQTWKICPTFDNAAMNLPHPAWTIAPAGTFIDRIPSDA